MQERIQKILSARGVASRRQAEEMISAGRVTCNGTVCNLGDRADPELDAIFVDGKPIPSPQDLVYIMLNKPRGYVTTLSDEKGRKNVAQLVESCGVRVYPVGRLDKNSEGILSLTDDGALANRLMHPRHTIGKYYRVKVGGRVTPEQHQALTSPMVIDGYTIRPVQVTIASEDDEGTVLKMTLFEGRNRQIRKMCEQVGLTVRRLSRVAIGKIKLNGLPVGHYRHLTEEEVEYLYQNTKS